MEKKEKIDLILILIHPVFATLFAHLLRLNAFGSVLIFFGIPSIYLTIRKKEYAKKALLFSLALGVPSIIIIDYIAHITKQWVIPYSILPFRLFGIVSLEVILWAIFNVYYIIYFYEYFLDKHVTKKLWYPHLKYLIALLFFFLIVFISFYSFFPTLLYIPYFYFWFGILLIIIPLLLEFIEYPKLLSKFLRTAAYFFYLTFFYEITALQLGWWEFPDSHFIGWISFFTIRFPLEEFIFWIVLFAMAVLTYYEYFDDDEK